MAKEQKQVKIAGRIYDAGVSDYTTETPMAERYGQKPQDFTKEHQTIRSRTNGKDYEISSGPLPGGLAFKNPFASQAQAGYMHTHPEVLGKQGLAEWDKATKGKSLPKKVKKS